MRNILDQIVAPSELTEAAINKAIADNIRHLLRHDMSRFAYARAATAVDEFRGLPPMHVMEHRLRLPAVDFSTDCAAEDKYQAVSSRIRERLNLLLLSSDHPGGRELIREALHVDPSVDTEELAQAFELSQHFVQLLLCGRLGSAIKLIPSVDWGSFGNGAALELVQRLLVYHAAFQVQLIAGRGRAIDRLFLRDSPNLRACSDAESCKQLCETLRALERIVGKISGKTKQPPQTAIVVDRKPRADELRDNMPSLSDDDIVAQAADFFRNRPWDLKLLREQICALSKEASTETLHKAVYGATSVEALLFAATRLIQLRSSAEKLVTSPAELMRFTRIDESRLPPIDDADVARVLFVYRTVILMDDHAPPTTRLNATLIDLHEAWTGTTSSGNLPAANTAKKRGRQLKSPAFNRTCLARRLSHRLEYGQRIDILPEFLLQRYTRVRPVLPDTGPLALAKRKREQELAQRPPNIRRLPRRAARQ